MLSVATIATTFCCVPCSIASRIKETQSCRHHCGRQGQPPTAMLLEYVLQPLLVPEAAAAAAPASSGVAGPANCSPAGRVSTSWQPEESTSSSPDAVRVNENTSPTATKPLLTVSFSDTSPGLGARLQQLSGFGLLWSMLVKMAPSEQLKGSPPTV